MDTSGLTNSFVCLARLMSKKNAPLYHGRMPAHASSVDASCSSLLLLPKDALEGSWLYTLQCLLFFFTNNLLQIFSHARIQHNTLFSNRFAQPDSQPRQSQANGTILSMKSSQSFMLLRRQQMLTIVCVTSGGCFVGCGHVSAGLTIA